MSVAGFALTSEAFTDLDEALAFLGSKSPRGAQRLLNDLEAAFEHVGRYPDSGILREFVAFGPVRFKVVGDYVVVYDPLSRPVMILRVLHGRRDLGRLLGEGE